MAGFGASFWDGVESEIEALDPADFALFLGADRLAIEPRPGVRASASRPISGRSCGARWSN